MIDQDMIKDMINNSKIKNDIGWIPLEILN